MLYIIEKDAQGSTKKIIILKEVVVGKKSGTPDLKLPKYNVNIETIIKTLIY